MISTIEKKLLKRGSIETQYYGDSNDCELLKSRLYGEAVEKQMRVIKCVVTFSFGKCAVLIETIQLKKSHK